MLNRFTFSLAALVLLTGSISAQSIDGKYNARGAGPGGANPYSGTVEIKTSDTAKVINWNLGPAATYKGLGFVGGQILAAAYAGDGKPFGLVIYLVKGGTLSGGWVQSPSMQTGEEVLTGPKGLDGTYTITSATNNKGASYSGKVTIKKTGDTYALKWILPNESYNGTGILLGEALVVAWSASTEYGVVAYSVNGGSLTGKWAAGGSDALGDEKLTKQK